MAERPDIHPGWNFAVRPEGGSGCVIWECLEIRDEEGIFLFRQKESAGAKCGTILREGTPFNVFQRALDEGRVRRIHSSGKGHREGRIGLEDLPPDSFDPQAAFRKAVCDTFDRDASAAEKGRRVRKYAKSDGKLDLLVRDVLVRNPQWRELDLCLSAGSVRRWLNDRGFPGQRRPEEMITRSGKTRRTKRRSGTWHAHLKWIVRWYWSLATRSPEDAKVHLDVMQDRLERFKRFLDPNFGPLERVSTTSIYKEIQRTTNFETWATKFSELAARQKFKGSFPTDLPEKFLDVVELDHTWADQHAKDYFENVPRNKDGKEIFVLDTERMLILGRPWVSLSRDLRTHMPLGHTIFFRNPSIYTMAELLRVTICSNEWMKAKYPFFNEVPAGHGRPSTLRLDNEWTHTGVTLKNICADFGTEIEWCPIHCPTAKAGIERSIGTIKRAFFHKSPGGVPLPPEQMRRLGLDPTKDVAMTLDQIESALVHFLYKDLPLRHSRALGMAPLQAWRNQAVLHHIPIVDDIKYLDAALGKVCRDLTLDRHGVVYKGLRFHDPVITEGLLRDLAHLRPRKEQRATTGSWSAKVTGKINPATVSRICIFNPVRSLYVELPNVDKSSVRSLDWETYFELKKFAHQNNLKFGTEEERDHVKDETRRRLEKGNPERRTIARQKQFRLRESLAPRAPVVDGAMILARSFDPNSRPVRRSGEIAVTLDQSRPDLTEVRKDPVRGKTTRLARQKTVDKALKAARDSLSQTEDGCLRSGDRPGLIDYLRSLGDDWSEDKVQANDPNEPARSAESIVPRANASHDGSAKGRAERRPASRGSLSAKPSGSTNSTATERTRPASAKPGQANDAYDPATFLSQLGTEFGF
ncbi:hypothetical protein [Methylobacterium brachiatum]